MPPRRFVATPRRYRFRATKGASMPAGSFTKDPVEEFPVEIDMTGRLPAGRTITRVTLSVIDLADALAVAGLFRNPSGLVIGKLAQGTVKAGLDGHRYKLYFDMFDNANSHYRQSLIMLVQAE
jgi:hypothetical protein